MREFNYWLRILYAFKLGDKNEGLRLVNESHKLKNILGKIANKVGKNLNK